MAITNIHPITATVNLCLKYVKRDKFEIHDNEIERHKTITTYHNCAENNDYQVFNKHRQYYVDSGRKIKLRKDGSENLAFHMVQSFDAKVDPNIANEIGRRVAQEVLSDYSCVISTHNNSEYTHNHFVFNAYNMDGSKKWNDCDKTKDNIRKISDRLCEEYGLSVIEWGRDYKPIHWKDKDGKRRTYEPSARKQKLRESHISSDQNSYDMIGKKIEHSSAKNLTFTEIVKKDIDDAVNRADTYDELLQLLRSRGYKVRAKKKDGEWLKHTSFLSPDGERPIRDSSLGADYSRSRLTERIAEKALGRNLDPFSSVDLRKYIQEDTNNKSQMVGTQKKQSLKENGLSEYLVKCINENSAALRTINKYGVSTLYSFQNKLMSASSDFDVMSKQLFDIQNSMFKIKGMSALVKYYGLINPELSKLQGKYNSLHGFFGEYLDCILALQRLDAENSRLFTNEIESMKVFTNKRFSDILNGEALLSDILGSMPAEIGIGYPSVSQLTTIPTMKGYPDYAAAKAGDIDAAYRFAKALLSEEDRRRKIEELGKKYRDAVIVAVHAVEETGENRIPLALAGIVSEMTGIELEYDIVQSNKVGRTNSNAMYRLANRPKFDGPVQKGRRYILIDDVITAGGTLEELRYYIESKGGKVEHFLTAAAAQFSTNIALSGKTRFGLISAFGELPLTNFLKEHDLYGGNIGYLTESEGRAILRSGSLDRARDQIAKEKHAGSLQKDTRALGIGTRERDR